jgi:pimeloyl-ACP methyl ester carboxylesterase
MPSFDFHGWRLSYTEFGGGPAVVTAAGRRGRTARRGPGQDRPLIMAHAVMLSQTMHWPLAEFLAARGNRVITLDLLGHGHSDRPRELARYTMGSFSRQIEALMDHLALEEAVLMGTSLGANASLELACRAPERLRGLVIEMPVLEGALVAGALAFTPLLIALQLGEPALRLASYAARAVPRRVLPHYGNMLLDVFRQNPAAGASVLQGLFYGRIGPEASLRRQLQTPALVVGHRRDPVHPFADAGMLASEMPNARLVEANSVLELRIRPARLRNEVAAFVDEVWGARRPQAKAPSTRARSAPAPASAGSRAGTA